MSYRTFSALVFLVASSQAGCGDHSSEVQVSPAIVRPTPPPGIRNAKIPASVTYSIIKDEHIKFPERDTRYVDFRLNQKVSEDVLREIGDCLIPDFVRLTVLASTSQDRTEAIPRSRTTAIPDTTPGTG